MAITAEMVKKLREQTGAGMMDCKKALTETNGDYDKAVTLLREKGVAVAAKRESKSASEGLIASYISDDAKSACLLEANCETSFVAKTDEFVELAKNLAKQVCEAGCCTTVEQLMDQPYPGGPTVKDRFTELMGKIGEKLAITRFVRMQTDGIVGAYIHTGDQIAVLVELKGAAASDEAKNLAKDIAMHISWSNPDYMCREDISAEAIEKERDVHRQWAIKEGKPEKIIDRIVDGRMKEFYSRVCLVEQPFIKDEDQIIGDLIKSASSRTGEDIKIASYVRFRVGETAGDSE